MAIISAGRMASTIDDEVRASEEWPSLKRQLPYSHAPCYRAIDEVDIVAVSDLDEAKCRTFCSRWEVERYYLDYREMITTEKPDIVSVATPAESHAELAVFAMNNAVPGIYCEKAMCCSLHEADTIVDTVERQGAVFMLGAQRRHHPHFREARRIVESGRIGELVSVTSWLGSALLHSLSHAVDGSLFLAGDAEPEWVSGLLGNLRSSDLIEQRRVTVDRAYDPATGRWNGDPGCLGYTARLRNGVLVQHAPAVADLRWEVCCTDGLIRIVNNNDSIELYERHGGSYSFDRATLPEIPPASSHVLLVKDLVGCLRNGGKPLANEIVARGGMEILMGCAASDLDEGRRMALPLADRGMYIPSH